MDEALEFRPPQFSEDLAWLPGWVQHQVEQFDECVKEPLASSKLEYKDSTLFQGNVCRRRDQSLSSREEGTHNNYSLFLSGEDNSPSSLPSSCSNMLQFHLHLSSDGSAQCFPSQPDTFQTVYGTEKVLSMQKFEASIALKQNSCETSYNAGGLNNLSQSSNPEPCLLYPSNSKDSMTHYGEKFSVRHLKDAEINDAVELSIAASEALIIHEIVKSKPDLEALVTTDALEISLRVKQARLEWLQDAFDSSRKETDDGDSLSDLDDFNMTDAFEDVGLIWSSSDQNVSASAVSLVKETPASGNHCGREDHFEPVELCAQQVNVDGISTQKQFEDDINLDAVLRKDLPLESLNSDRQEKVLDVDVFCSNTTIERENDPLTPKKQSAVSMSQMVGSAAVDLISSQHPTEENIANHDSSLDNARENRVTFPVPERFRSRWLGGWTAEKEVDTSAQLKQNNAARSILKAFTCETSFLSESADVAPDENSFFQIRETSFKGASQSSVAVDDLLERTSNKVLLSQDVVRSLSLSLVDPLCSAVPCSISSEDPNATEARNQNNKETDFERDFRTGVELEMGTLGNMTSLNVQIRCGDEQVMHLVDENSEGIVRRQLTSLKTYSTLFPNNVAISHVGSLHNNRSIQSQLSLGHLALNQNMGCIGDSDKGCSKQIPLLNSVCTSFARRKNEESCETMGNGKPIEKLKKKRTTNLETTRDVGKGRVQPVLLNHRVRRRMQASKPYAVSSYREDHISFQPSERPQNIQSDYKNLHNGRFAARKRVRFSEVEVQIEPNKNAREPHFFRSNCSTTTTNKKLKNIDKLSDYCILEESFLNRCSNVGKELMIFQGIRFLPTGLSRHRGKDIKEKIQKYGGIVLCDIPFSPNTRGKRFSRSNSYQLPIILSPGKRRSTKFLYGCAVKALILNVDWLTDSIGAGSILPPEKYLILRWHDGQSSSIWKQVHDDKSDNIFEKVGIMLHGKHSFCTKFAKIVKHGGGQAYKTLQWLVHNLEKEKISVGAIVAEDENTASRHLRQCACERRIPMMPVGWIIKSLHSGKLLPFTG